MADFMILQNAVHKQLTKMTKHGLFTTNVEKSVMFDSYLDAFPNDFIIDGVPTDTNPVYKTRREYDCQCCKQFIRTIGNVVAVIDGKMVSVWDIEVGGFFQIVVDELSALVKSSTIKDVFYHYQADVGTKQSNVYEDGSLTSWDHFYFKLPAQFVKPKCDIPTKLGDIRSTKDVFKRGMQEITKDAVNTVIELIEQKSIYRGEEHLTTVRNFSKNKTAFDKVSGDDQDNYCWVQAVKHGHALRTKNSSIGQLLSNISEGMTLDVAVGKFEAMVAPSNYKRPTALITKAMIQKAQDTVEELGIGDSLQRRYAVTEDVTINNVIYADRTVKAAMNVFDELMSETPDKVNLDKIEEVDVKTFMETILPKAESLEVMLENKHTNNLMSLLSPSHPDAPPILKWGNNFSWSYNGDITDSMKERVKAAGGKVDGVLRYSIQWNDQGDNSIDFDAHCIEPNKNRIYFSSPNSRVSGGTLDVDITNPGKKVAVENITWNNLSKMLEGEYEFKLHNYSSRTSKAGFTAEIEYDGVIHSYVYDKPLKGNETVLVALADFTRADGLKIKKGLSSTHASKEAWGIPTQKFHKVNMVMNSPNHWDGNETGNKHLFFILDGCKNEEGTRGFYNEFLKDELHTHRKVFEVLGSKMRVEPSDNQLSGLGFSSTQRNTLVVKVTGTFARTIKVKF